MNSASHCHLLVPGMMPEFAAASPTPPALRTLLRHGQRKESFAGDADAWLCRYFAVDIQQDWPVAPYCALADGLDPGASYWMCASPVHLQPQRDSLLIAAGVPGAFEPAQARQLIETLNAHFAGEGLQFFAPFPGRWYLRMADAPALRTHALATAWGRPVNDLLPRGADALPWHSRINEIQMLLHEHPVNVTLEQGGAWPINSLWLWGGGVLPQPRASQPMAVWAQSPLARGLAMTHGADLSGPPTPAGDWLADTAEISSRLAVLDHLQLAAEEQDMRAWAGALQMLDQQVFTPILQNLRQGRLSRVSLHFVGRGGVSSYQVRRADLWKFWRPARALETCLD